MQDIEIRRTVEATRAISIDANPAIYPGVNGDPDEVVVALEIDSLGDDRNGTGRDAFAIPLSVLEATIARLRLVQIEASALAEELT